jgi:hypothetical protein
MPTSSTPILATARTCASLAQERQSEAMAPPALLIRTARELWQCQWRQLMGGLGPADAQGRYRRPASPFTTLPPVPDDAGEPGAHVLIVGRSCPWAHRAALVHSLRGLAGTIELLVEWAYDNDSQLQRPLGYASLADLIFARCFADLAGEQMRRGDARAALAAFTRVAQLRPDDLAAWAHAAHANISEATTALTRTTPRSFHPDPGSPPAVPPASAGSFADRSPTPRTRSSRHRPDAPAAR